jgi:LSD1 subclass zinc finger protein
VNSASTTARVELAARLCGLPDSLLPAQTPKIQPSSEADLVRLRALLVCPACRGRLDWGDREIRCASCGAVYEVVDEIPVLRAETETGDTAHKEQQSAFFDAADPEFETTRPHGTP